MSKIKHGDYIDFKELLGDNISLLEKLQEVGNAHMTPLTAISTASKLRSVKDPLSWAYCFLGFIAAKVEVPQARELAAYGQLVIHMARKHGGRGWLAYDTLFRQQRAAGSLLPWTDINASLMAATVLGSGGESSTGKVCSLCAGSDHVQSECALNLLHNDQLLPPTSCSSSAGSSSASSSSSNLKPPNRRYTPYPGASASDKADNRCRRFNRGACSANPCRFEHNCSFCNGPHMVVSCPRLEQHRPAKPKDGPPSIK